MMRSCAAIGSQCRYLALFALSSAALISANPAGAQSAPTPESLDQRLQRVERVVDSSLLNLAQKVGEAQNEIRELRGEIENLRNDLDLLDRRNRDLYQDSDKRLMDLERGASGSRRGQLEGLGGEKPPRGTNPVIPLDGRSGSGPTDNGAASSDDRGAGQGAGQAPVIVLDPSDDSQSGAGSGTGDPQPPQQPVTDNSTRVATAPEQRGYREAYDLLASGYNEEAVAAFDRFLVEFPEGPYSDNAWYWQGEAMYARRQFDDAIRNFTVVADFFPNSPKVPDARLKIGFALFEQQKFDKARTTLTEVQDAYPGRSASVLARKRLQEMSEDDR